jgi:hypothetical protein
MLKRLFPTRWARIVAWTGAAVAWGTSVVAVQAATNQDAAGEPAPTTLPEVQEVQAPVAAVPAPPERGLVVIRYTPVPPPPPEVITRTVSVAGNGGGSTGGGTATSTSGGGGGGGTTASRPTIKSAGS